MSEQSPPAGFAAHFRKSTVTDPWEPLYSRTSAEAVEIGLWLKAAHCNSRGFLHGGVIATLADNAMGLSYLQFATTHNKPRGEASGSARGAVTISLAVDYVATAKLGQWVQISPRVVRGGRTLGFVDALVTADGQVIARANATFNVVT